MIIQGQVAAGASSASITPGTQTNLRTGQLGDTIVSELHGRFYEQTYRSNVYSAGLTTLTSISNATFTSATGLSGTLGTAATGTPIVGLWNPLTSTVNAVILQATLAVTMTALTATGAGGFVWGVYAGNGAISTGNAPINRRLLTATGSQCKNLSGLALTGLTATGVAAAASALNGGSIFNVSEVGTAAGFHTLAQSYTENLDGSFVIPPGGVLALFATTTPVALSAISSLIWEEIPL